MSKKKTAKKKTTAAKKKTATKKAATKATKKAAAKKAPTSKKAAKKATGAKSGAAVKKTAGKKKKTAGKAEAEESKVDKATKEAVLKARTRKHTPAIFKIKAKNTPIVFTLDDVQDIIKKKKDAPDADEETVEEKPAAKKKAAKKKVAAVKPLPTPQVKNSTHAAASLTDILGFNPSKKEPKKYTIIDEKDVPSKWKKNYDALITIRNNIINGLNLHTQETLQRSSKDDSGDLSGYSQHMADSGTENFDRDFVLSLVSSEQEALHEVEEAIKRIADGTYGTCEITGKPIKKERLLAVPFTRHSLEGQRELEANRQNRVQERSNPFSEISGDDTIKLSDPEDDE